MYEPQGCVRGRSDNSEGVREESPGEYQGVSGTPEREAISSEVGEEGVHPEVEWEASAFRYSCHRGQASADSGGTDTERHFRAGFSSGEFRLSAGCGSAGSGASSHVDVVLGEIPLHSGCRHQRVF